MVAKIALAGLTYAIDKPYSYRCSGLNGQELRVGQRVVVPFGFANRPVEGVVLAVEDGDEENLKPIREILEDAPALSEEQLRLAAFLRERYFSTFYDALRAVLPAGLGFRQEAVYALTQDVSWKQADIRKPGARLLLETLEAQGGSAKGEALAAAYPHPQEREQALSYLLRKKWICTQVNLRRRVSDKTEQIATLAVTVEEAMEFSGSLPQSARIQRAVVEQLCAWGSGSVKDLCYYTGATRQTVKRLEKRGLLTLSKRPVLRIREFSGEPPAEPLTLTPAQELCAQGLAEQLGREQPGVALLHGVTGSGKTQVYIRLIQNALAMGKSAILLVPEIALTPQLLERVGRWFPNEIAVLHSSLPQGERCDQWRRVHEGKARVVVGTRSAVFAPCQNLGLIILDEEQEHSYKSDNSPRYHAREVAIWRTHRAHALTVLGSATPSIESMYLAKTGEYTLYTLPERYNGAALPEAELVDMGQELRQGNDLALSMPLRQAIADTHAAGKQSILLLNRRGNSRCLVCVDCREAPQCPRCSVRLTYHSANHRLMCHYCGHSQPVPPRCPTCGGPLKTVGVGTQKLQLELKSVFPDLTVARMDADTVSAANTHADILNRFTQEHQDILLGTQMVAKGLDMPEVTLVGVVDADMSLYAPGFRAAETTFDMLAQVVGRAGRGQDPGRAIIQTTVPEHQVLRQAAQQDYTAFYELELPLRRLQKVPPFGDHLLITFIGMEETWVLQSATIFRDSLLACAAQPPYRDVRIECFGPAPCPVERLNWNHRYRLTVKCELTRQIRQLLSYLLVQFGQDKRNRHISAYIDVNGYE